MLVLCLKSLSRGHDSDGRSETEVTDIGGDNDILMDVPNPYIWSQDRKAM